MCWWLRAAEFLPRWGPHGCHEGGRRPVFYHVDGLRSDYVACVMEVQINRVVSMFALDCQVGFAGLAGVFVGGRGWVFLGVEEPLIRGISSQRGVWWKWGDFLIKVAAAMATASLRAAVALR